MNIVSNSKKLQATKSTDQKIHFLNNPVFHSLLVLTCSLIWFYLSCFSHMKHFLFLSLPNIFFSLSSPKWLFIVVNIIVVFLIGESKFVGSHSSPAGEIYDEYVERSTSLRSSATLQGKAEGSKMDLEFDEEIISTDDVEHVEEVKCEDKEVIEIPEEEEKYQVTEVEDIEEEEEEAEEEKDDDDEDKEEDEEEIGLPAEELNKRVEEFIARVNKQRWLEARSFVCCEA